MNKNKKISWQAVFISFIAAMVVFFFVYGLGLQHGDARTLYEACKKVAPQKKESCYNEQFYAYARVNGAAKAFDTLNALQRIDPATQGCHFIAHGIGRGMYEHDPTHWRDNFQNINPECSYGAMHGILELAIRDLPGGLTAEFIPSICGETPRADCNHIVGHLTLVETEGKIPEALKLCGALKDRTQYDFCSSGVFMEEETADNLVAHGLADKSWLDWPSRKTSLEALCRGQGEANNAVQCWKEMAHVFIATEKADPKKSFADCANNPPSDKAKEECATHSVGILIAAGGFTERAMQGVCTAFGTVGNIDLCPFHAIASLLSSLPDATSVALSYCSSLSSETVQQMCFASLGNMLKYNPRLDEAGRGRVCADAPSAFRSSCTEGGNTYLPFNTLNNDFEIGNKNL